MNSLNFQAAEKLKWLLGQAPFIKLDAPYRKRYLVTAVLISKLT